MKTNHILAVAAGLLVAAPAMGATIPDNVKEAMKRPEVFAGVGVGSFTQDLGDVTGSGFGWEARVGVSPLRNFGAELDYQGLQTGVNTIVPVGGTPISGQNYHSNQITADARLNAPMMVGNNLLTPYALAGIGYARLSGDNSVSAVGLTDDNALAIPLGVGAAYNLTNVWAVDGRFTYNILTAVDTGPLAGSADSWKLGVNIGAHFGGTE